MPQRTISRRRVLAGGAALFAHAALRSTAGAADVPRNDAVFAYVGSYTPSGSGIALFAMNRTSGALTPIKTYTDITNPSWLALDPTRTHLYAVHETTVGAVTAYAIDRASGELTRLNTVSSQGKAPTHLSVHPSGKFVLVANYTSGSVAVLPIESDGTLGEATDVQTNTGQHNPAQAVDDPPGNFGPSDHSGAHVHMVATDPSGRFILANDAGLDRIYVWTLDVRSGKLRPGPTPWFAAPPGCAPRHFAFHPNGRVLYNLFEQDSILAVYDYDARAGALAHKQSISILPTGFAGSNIASELIISPDGRFVYAANRLHDTIALLAIAADGRVALRREEWTRADYPRSIALDPTGTFLFSCNQRGDAITTFVADAQTGALQFTGAYTPVGSPVTMTFLT